MVSNDYKVTQLTLRQADLRPLIDFNKNPTHEIFHTYQGLNLSKSRETDVGAAVGMMALGDIEEFGIPKGVIAQMVGGLRNAALIDLGMDPSLWRFSGSEEATAQFFGWMSDGAEYSRRLRVQELLDIFERPASRFLFVRPDRTLRATNSSEEWFQERKQRVSICLDAFAYADALRNQRPGALFTVEAKKGK